LRVKQELSPLTTLTPYVAALVAECAGAIPDEPKSSPPKEFS